MKQKSRSFNVSEKIMAETGTLRRSFDQSRNIGKYYILSVSSYNSQVGCERCKVIVSDLWSGAGDYAQNGAFSYVRISDQSDICNGFQFQPECSDFGFDSGF